MVENQITRGSEEIIMDFIKEFKQKFGRTANLNGSCVISEGNVNVRFQNTKEIVKIGIIEGGIGVVTKEKKPRKSPYTVGIYKNVDVSLYPPELKTKVYKYFIEGEKLGENETVFLFKNAKIMNKK